MKVLLDGRFIGYGGGGVFAARCYRELIPLLSSAGHQVAVVVTNKTLAHTDCVTLLQIPGVEKVVASTSCLTVAQHWRFRKEVKVHADCYFYPHFDMPWLCPYESVAFIHDIIPVAVPKYTSWLKRVFFDAVCSRTVHKALTIAVNSEHTRQTVANRYGISPDKIRVAYLGCDHIVPPSDPKQFRQTVERLGLRAGYMLYVGNCKPHKNLHRLLKAYAALPDNLRREHCFYIVGSKDDSSKAFEREIVSLGLTENVRHLGPQDDNALRAIYSMAHAFATVSLYEGFGIPPLEAMVCSVPCLVSNTTALGEVAGPAALTVNPEDAAAISSNLERLLTDPTLRTELAARGKALTKPFTWKRCAEAVLTALMAAQKP